jgi:DNA-binding response OmpR family regulator
VLLVDDDTAVLESVGRYLLGSGFLVQTATDGLEGLQRFRTQRPDVVVLDVAMPRMDGRGVLRGIREDPGWVPVILLTRFGESKDRAAALDAGADDYLNKPFDPVELVARVRALLRRDRPATQERSSRLAAGGLVLDRVARRVWLDGRELTLTPRAALLLEYLMERSGELHGRDRLLAVLWGFEHPVGTRAVDNRVAELRRALSDDPTDPRWIETVSGRGYRFLPAVEVG